MAPSILLEYLMVIWNPGILDVFVEVGSVSSTFRIAGSMSAVQGEQGTTYNCFTSLVLLTCGKGWPNGHAGCSSPVSKVPRAADVATLIFMETTAFTTGRVNLNLLRTK
jgi:hypothetical protein